MPRQYPRDPEVILYVPEKSYMCEADRYSGRRPVRAQTCEIRRVGEGGEEQLVVVRGGRHLQDTGWADGAQLFIPELLHTDNFSLVLKVWESWR